MLTTKRRGRPVGTDYKEDFEPLALVADRLVADKDLTPWPVMWAVCKTRKWRGSSDQAIVTRWLRKWKTQSASQLVAARERSADRRTSPIAATMNVAIGELSVSMSRLHAELVAASKPTVRAIEEIARAMNTPEMRALGEKHRKIAATLSEQMKNLPSISFPRGLLGG